MMDTSDLLLILKQSYILPHWGAASQILSSPHHLIYIPSFELIISHELGSFGRIAKLLGLLIVEFNTQKRGRILLASTNETNY